MEAGVTDPVADRVGVILTAVGSSDAAADRHVRRRAIELSTLLNRPVEVVFATKLGARDHRLRTAIRRLRSAGAERIAVSPYFLSAGESAAMSTVTAFPFRPSESSVESLSRYWTLSGSLQSAVITCMERYTPTVQAVQQPAARLRACPR